ncbi:MAG: nitrate/nitrite transport system ATP-binding protein, partial [Methylococcaceae bacterium NSP1-2]
MSVIQLKNMSQPVPEHNLMNPSNDEAQPVIELKEVCKSYGDGNQRSSILKNINLQVKDGEFIAIVGFSGSGKTTLISLIAGLLKADSGDVLKQGKAITEPGPDRGVVFQNYSLMPWLTVYENVALAVDQIFKDWSAAQRKAHTEKYIQMVSLTPAMHKKPAELSGGMRQRVNVARALAASPDILLLDEPLSALDALTRGNLQDEILQIWQQEKKTVILITNDVDEAIYMADRVIPLNPGPDATFGPDFHIDIPRPRDRTALNHNAEFKKLRAEITRYLMAIGMEKAGEIVKEQIVLPDVRPNTQHDYAILKKPAAHDLGKPRYLEFSRLSKIYPTPNGNSTVKVVDGFDMMLKKGEFISIIGHSGCGKSTVLSMTAGLTDISE